MRSTDLATSDLRPEHLCLCALTGSRGAHTAWTRPGHVRRKELGNEVAHHLFFEIAR
jgi:hypothetical protein